MASKHKSRPACPIVSGTALIARVADPRALTGSTWAEYVAGTAEVARCLGILREETQWNEARCGCDTGAWDALL